MQTEKIFRYTCGDTGELPALASGLLSDASEVKVFAFSGDLGAGKTTLIGALCSELGVTDVVTSPTFTIVNEYRTQTGDPVYHFDFYRIKTSSEALDLGYEQYLYSGNYCFIEWPEKIEGLLPDHIANVKIRVIDGTREITMSL